MRSPLPQITESVEYLHERLLAERRQRLKVRIMALWMLKSGQCTTREAVAEALGVHRHTITRWLSKYRRGGLDELLTIRTRPNRKRVVPDSVMRALEHELRVHPEQFSSFKDVQAWLAERYGLRVKYKTIYRLVRYELGLDVGRPPAARTDERPADLSLLIKRAARFINGEDVTPDEVSATVHVLASLVRDGKEAAAPSASTDGEYAEAAGALRRLADQLEQNRPPQDMRPDRPAAVPPAAPRFRGPNEPQADSSAGS